MDDSTVLKGAHKVSDINISRAKSGDKAAFSILIDQHRITLYRVAKGILKSDFDVADALQETIISAYNNIGKLKKEEYFKTWIIRILINECKKILKNSKKVVSIEEVNEQSVVDTYPSDRDTARFINMLEPELKYVIVLYYYEDLSVKEIADILKIPQGTVKSRLQRARGKLLKLMSENGGMENEKCL